MLDGLRIADAAAQLDITGEIFDNALNRFGIFGASRKGAVQIDHMQKFRTLFRK